MLRSSTEQRRLLADKLLDLANVAAAALVFGQFLGDGRLSPAAIVAGFLIWMGLAGFALVLQRRQ